MHRSPPLLLLCLLVFATGVACLRAAAVVTPPLLPPPSPNLVAATQVATVHRFYTAVNTALRTGDVTTLEPLVAAELIAHPAPLDGPSGRAALVQPWPSQQHQVRSCSSLRAENWN